MESFFQTLHRTVKQQRYQWKNNSNFSAHRGGTASVPLPPGKWKTTTCWKRKFSPTMTSPMPRQLLSLISEPMMPRSLSRSNWTASTGLQWLKLGILFAQFSPCVRWPRELAHSSSYNGKTPGWELLRLSYRNRERGQWSTLVHIILCSGWSYIILLNGGSCGISWWCHKAKWTSSCTPSLLCRPPGGVKHLGKVQRPGPLPSEKNLCYVY